MVLKITRYSMPMILHCLRDTPRIGAEPHIRRNGLTVCAARLILHLGDHPCVNRPFELPASLLCAILNGYPVRYFAMEATTCPHSRHDS